MASASVHYLQPQLTLAQRMRQRTERHMLTLIFDTETTDLMHNSQLPLTAQPRIIEFYGHIINTKGETVDELEFMCDPGVPVTKTITEITGIHAKDVVGKPAFSKKAPAVVRLLGSCDMVVGHNLAFDFSVVNVEFKRCQEARITLPEITWPIRRLCTVQETEWIKGYRLSLSALHEHLFGTPFEGAHRARQDVQALTRCYMALRTRGDV
jgi:DNA polymerase-3 subunit alpha